jgi:DNA-binding MarR family transcriptional regulator/predicted N-acetyltransferase YhbS
MDRGSLDQVRRFNRFVAQRVGALDQSYLRRGRPLGEARIIFEIGAGGADVGELRGKLGLDSGYMSRLLRSLEDQGLVESLKSYGDGRKRRAVLTGKGRAEHATYDRLSDRLAASMLAPLEAPQRERLTAAMGEVERLMRAGRIAVALEAPDSADARACLAAYFRELAARFEGGFDPQADRGSLADAYKPPDGAFVVARLEGAAVGCGALKRVDRTTGEIKRVWCDPAARGLGVARRMLRRLEATARDMGVTTLRLDTNRALKEAHDLYRKEGYREIARFNDNPYAHHWFAKRL